MLYPLDVIIWRFRQQGAVDRLDTVVNRGLLGPSNCSSCLMGRNLDVVASVSEPRPNAHPNPLPLWLGME